MLAKRLLSVIVLIPVIAALAVVGGWPFALFVAAVLGVAAWEFWRIFHQGGYDPSWLVLITSAVGLTLARYAWGFVHSDLLLALFALWSMGIQVVRYEMGREQPASSFAINLAGVVYVGWLGAYILSLRSLPDGTWWLMMVLGAVWLADGGAYLIGSQFGKHRMTPRVSPNKTWEGYFGGIALSIPGTWLVATLFQQQAAAISGWKGLVIGAVIAILAPLGDLGMSMVKRQFGVKDSSHLIPGHGGFLDRLDSILWAVALGYYLAVWL